MTATLNEVSGWKEWAELLARTEATVELVRSAKSKELSFTRNGQLLRFNLQSLAEEAVSGDRPL